jgi:NADH:ubiquinone oxidoreductase subunit 5 (subunit L)/multisubunit Na+/H+ antiporter MnhA subunit
MAVYNVAWAVVLLPLVGAALSFLAESPRRAAQTCVVTSVLTLILAAVVLGARLTHPLTAPFYGLVTFFSMNPPEGTVFATTFQPQLGVLVDSLSASFAFAAVFVVAVVQSYALTSLRGDAGLRRFFWSSSLLASATLGFIFSPNLFDSLFTWMLATVAVYLLVGLWWDHQDAATPARRVLLTLHVGDIALMLGAVVAFIKFGVYASGLPAPAGQPTADPFGFDILARATTVTLHGQVAGAGLRTVAILAAIFIFAAVVRAAQLPFHVWLSDASTAPAPSLALASGLGALLGVLLLARVYPVLEPARHALTALALTGAVTALVAGVTCLVQRDILRIAALSAVVQLGLAAVALGMGGYSQGMFVLFETALFTPLAVLVAGNLVRMYRTRNIHEMGGAWRRMRATSVALGVWALGVGGMALGTYYALAATFRDVAPGGTRVSGAARAVVAVLVVLAAIVAALYALRVTWFVCAGTPFRRRGLPDRITDVERPLRRGTLIAAAGAVLAVLAGLPGIAPVHAGKVSIPGLTFTRFVYLGARPSLPVDGFALILSLGALALGAVIAMLVFAPARRAAPAALAQRYEPLLRVVARGFFIERYAHRLGRPLLVAAGFVARFDDAAAQTVGETFALSGNVATSLLSRARTPRTSLYLAGSLAVIAVLALLSVLAATGHFWIHSV